MAPKSDTERRARPLLLPALLGAGLIVTALRGGSYAPVARGELFVVVLWVLVLGVALGLLPLHRAPRGVVIAVTSLLALAAWTMLGLLWTESAERTVTEVARTLGLAAVLVLVASTFGGRGWAPAVGMVAAAGAVVCVVALVSRLAPDLLPSPIAQAGLFRRLAYPLDYWNALGTWAAMTVALGLALSAHAPAGWVRGLTLAAVCIAVPVAYLTYSRSGAVAVALAVLGVLAVARHRWQVVLNALMAAAGSAAIVLVIRAYPQIANGRGTDGALAVAAIVTVVVVACLAAGLTGSTGRLAHFRLAARAARASAVGVGLVVLAAGVAVGPAVAREAWSSFEQREERQAPGDPVERLGNLSGIRRELWESGLDAFADHPLRGTGAGTYEFVWNRDPDRDSFVRDAHSLYLETLAELGLPGALLVVGAMATLLLTGLRAARRQTDAAAAGAAGGCAVAFGVFCLTAGVDWLWELTAVTALGLACGALAAVPGSPVAAPLRVPWRVGASAAALACLAVQLPVLAGAAEIRESRRAIREGHVDAALAAADTAVSVQPWASSAYLQRALVLERMGQLGPAAEDARRAARREPTNWQPWLILGRIEAERGRSASALVAAREARRLNPRSPLFAPR